MTPCTPPPQSTFSPVRPPTTRPLSFRSIESPTKDRQSALLEYRRNLVRRDFKMDDHPMLLKHIMFKLHKI
jgi:hypothetical protein